jgi:hypothetical protein
VGLPLRKFMWVERNTFRQTVRPEAPALHQPVGSRDQLPRLGDGDPGDPDALDVHRLDPDGHGRAGQVGDQGGQATEVLMGRMKTGDATIVFDPQLEIPAVGVRQADDGCDQIAVVQPVAITLELDCETFALGNVGCHLAGPFYARILVSSPRSIEARTDRDQTGTCPMPFLNSCLGFQARRKLLNVAAHESLGRLDGDLSLTGASLVEAEHRRCQPADCVAVHRPWKLSQRNVFGVFLELEQEERIAFFVKARFDRREHQRSVGGREDL